MKCNKIDALPISHKTTLSHKHAYLLQFDLNSSRNRESNNQIKSIADNSVVNTNSENKS
jgi:hypothetical protein